MDNFKQITSKWNSWLLAEQEGSDLNQKKAVVTAGKTYCRYYKDLARVGLPNDLWPFHLVAAVQVGEKVVGWIQTAFKKDNKTQVYYASIKVEGAQTNQVLKAKGGANAAMFQTGLSGIDGYTEALAALAMHAKISDRKKYTFKWQPDKNWVDFSSKIASGKEKVEYCKGPTAAVEKTPEKTLEKDDICNNKLVLKVQKTYSKRLPGVQMKNASPKIVISVCKIQRVLNSVLGNSFPASEIDGVIGPKTMKALQKAYHLMKPSKRGPNEIKITRDNLIRLLMEMEMSASDDVDCNEWEEEGWDSKEDCCNSDADVGNTCEDPEPEEKKEEKKEENRNVK